MAPFRGTPTHNQQVTLALTPKVAGLLSIVGSCYILLDCWRKPKRSRTTFHRLMMGLCIADLTMSTGFFASSWAMPADTPNVWNARGTVRSCEIVGFLVQSSVAAVLYNGSLSIYYLLRIRFGWTPERFRKIEWCLHLVPIAFGIGTMIAGLTLDLFNSAVFDCWIAPYPQGCKQSWQNGGETTCKRGDNASLYQWIFDLIPKWLSTILVTVNMWLTHRAVYWQEQATLRMPKNGNSTNTNSSSSNNTNAISNRSCSQDTATSSTAVTTIRNGQQPPLPRMAKQLARQSYLYVGALYLTWFPVTVTRMTELITGHVYYEMLLIISIAIPAQGFWNVIVYLRPRYLRKQELRNRSVGRLRSPTEEASSKSYAGAFPNRTATLPRFISMLSEVVWEGAISDEELEDSEELAIEHALNQ